MKRLTLDDLERMAAKNKRKYNSRMVGALNKAIYGARIQGSIYGWYSRADIVEDSSNGCK